MLLAVLAGLPGTGKSALARGLSARLGLAVLDKDAVRASLFAPDEIEYSAEQDDLCFRIVLQLAEHRARRGRAPGVVLDGRTFSRARHVREVEDWARPLELVPRWIECVCSETAACERLARDQRAGGHPAENRSPELYRAIAAAAEPLQVPRLVLRTDVMPLEACVERALAYLNAPDG